MRVVVWLIAGGVVGWVAGLLMKRRDGVLLDIVIGIVGSILGGWFIAPHRSSAPPPSTRAPSPLSPCSSRSRERSFSSP